jgi:sec-independent protein translocase protein TatA
MNSFSPMFAIGPFGPTELIIILFIVLLLFGAKKLPDLARGLGKSVSEFKKGSSEAEREIKDAIESEPKPAEKKSEPAKSAHGSN